MDTSRMPKASGTKPLATPRLNLRPFKKRDAASLASWSIDAETLKYFVTPPLDEPAALNNISAWRLQYSEPSFMHWCIAEADSDNCVGLIDAVADEQQSSIELSYVIAPSCRKKGYASEAVREVIRYLHEECGFHRIAAEINTENIASTRVAEKSGMELEGILRDALTNRNGEFYDVAVFAHIA